MRERTWQITTTAINLLIGAVVALVGLYFLSVVDPIKRDIGDIKTELRSLRSVLLLEYRVTKAEERLKEIRERVQKAIEKLIRLEKSTKKKDDEEGMWDTDRCERSNCYSPPGRLLSWRFWRPSYSGGFNEED